MTTTMKRITAIVLILINSTCIGATTMVTRVIDGDTFETESGETVRLIGINAPEISDFFGQESKQYLSKLIENKHVDLQTDPFSSERDRYQRLLRYIIIEGEDINLKMVSDGYAFAYLKYNFRKAAEYEQAQIEAREANNGIWGDNNEKTKVTEQEQKQTNFWQDQSSKFYFVGSLVIILIVIGLLNYFKKN